MRSPRNVLLITVDCLRADHLGCYGYARPTSPSIDAFAAGSTVFDRFFASAIPTQPSFTTTYSGQYSITHGIVSHKGDNDLAPSSPWLPSIARQAGMTTAAFCCLPRYKQWFLRGFEFVIDSTTRHHDYGYTAEVLNSRVVPWLRHHADERFFAIVHYWDPHTPYLPPDKYRDFYQGDPADPALPDGLAPLRDQYFWVMWEKWFAKLPEGLRDPEYVVSLYDGEVLRADDGVGSLLQALDETGHADDTLVLLISDHGELFYRHDVFFDHHGLYDGNIHCPLIVRWPGVTVPGRRLSSFAGHQDLAPTILSALDQPVPDAMDGSSLTDLLRGGAHAIRDYAVSAECTWQKKWALRTATEKLILARAPDFHGNPQNELFDLAADPHELHNVAAERPERTQALEDRLEAWIAEAMAKTGLEVDPLIGNDITLGKQWEEWAASRPSQAR
jgi:arylsulfatase A-like enzyme